MLACNFLIVVNCFGLCYYFQFKVEIVGMVTSTGYDFSWNLGKLSNTVNEVLQLRVRLGETRL